MSYRTLLGMVLTAAIGIGQHVQFGPLLHGLPLGKPAMDSRGNLLQLNQTLALGMCCGVGTRLVVLLEQYNRDGSSRLLADTFLTGNGDVPLFVAVDSRDRVYVGADREARPLVLRFDGESNGAQFEVFAPGTHLVGMGFAGNGDAIVAGSTDSVTRVLALDGSQELGEVPGVAQSMVVDRSGAVYLAIGSSIVRLGGATVDIGRQVTALAVGADGAVYAAGSDGAIVRLGGSVSMALAGAAINGLAVDASGRVVAEGVMASTGGCGPVSQDSAFLARLDAGLERVERKFVAKGLTAVGMPAGYANGPVFFALGGSVAAVDLDRDETAEVACVVSGASYRALTALTPGQLLTVFGRGLGSEIWIDGLRAEVLWASPEQVNVVVPMGIGTNVWLEMPGVYTRNFRWTGTNAEALLRVDSGGRALGADAFNADGGRNGAEAPAPAGSFLTVMTAGMGVLDETGRPLQRFVVYTENGRIEDVSVEPATGAVMAVRFPVPEGAAGPVPFWIVPEYAQGPLGAGSIFFAR